VAFDLKDGKTWFPVHPGYSVIRDGYLELYEFRVNELNIIKRIDINDRKALSEIMEISKSRCAQD
jgi:hypothetical protein